MQDVFTPAIEPAIGIFMNKKVTEFEEHIKKFFDETLPKFLREVEPVCAEHKFIVADTITIADFRLGGLYTNYIMNDAMQYGRDQYGNCLDNFPNFKAYGERFTKEN